MGMRLPSETDMGSGSDSEGAPEEVTLDEGREEASKAQSVEKAARKRVLVEAKELRRKRSKKSEDAAAALNPEQEDTNLSEPQTDASASGRLPSRKKNQTRLRRRSGQDQADAGLQGTDAELGLRGRASEEATGGASGLEGLGGAETMARSENGRGVDGGEKDKSRGRGRKPRPGATAVPLLPASVIEALAERERNAAKAELVENPQTEDVERNRKKKKETKGSLKIAREGVHVARLPKPNAAVLPPPSEAALQFKHHHLFGSRVKRSMRMLRQTAIPASKSAFVST